MPKRVKNHVTGADAVIEFQALVKESNANWATREKSEDYGVDLEIEVFDRDDVGRGTNLIAYIQSKGTASDTKRLPFSMSLESLNYLNSFEVPAIIFRHSTTQKKSYWMWVQEAIWYSKPNAKSVKLNFTEAHIWTKDTPDEIERSLFSARALRKPHITTRFPIDIDYAHSSLDSLELADAMAQISKNITFCNSAMGCADIPIQITITDKEIKIQVERFLWRQVEIENTNQDYIFSCVMYLLVSFWQEFSFHKHAELTALKCLELELKAPNREIAGEACNTLLNFPMKSVDLAELNQLHISSDIVMNMYSINLHNSIIPDEDKILAVEKFTELVLAESRDPKPNSAILYNLAALYRGMGKQKDAVKTYNRLRTLDHTYTKRSYFWRELGSVLYGLERYSIASKCYLKLLEFEDIPITRLFCGDALLYNMRYSQARNQFEKAASSPTSIGAEASLKCFLCGWLLTFNENQEPSLNDYDKLLALRTEFLEKNDLENGFCSHLAMSFIFIDDIEHWADAIMMSLQLGNMALMQDVLINSIKIHGLQAYLRFKNRRKEFVDIMGDAMIELDNLANTHMADILKEPEYRPGVTIGEREKLINEGFLRIDNLF